jgi:chromate transporter
MTPASPLAVTGWAMLGMHGMGWAELAQLGGHFMLLSLLAVGGAITTAPDMQRYLVHEQGWMSAEQFTASVAIAQSAPGPNILFVALMGWQVAGLAGVVATMGGIMLPSSVLALNVARYGRRRADALPMRAFTGGMVPVTLGLLLSTGWLLAAPVRAHPVAWVLVLGTAIASARTRISLLWLMAAGATLGMLGWV